MLLSTQPRLLKWCSALVPAAVIGFASLSPAEAAPRVAALEQMGSAELIQVGSRGYDWGQRHHYRGHRSYHNRKHAYRHHKPHYYKHHKRRHDNRDAFIAGAIGLAAGTIIGNAITTPRYAAPAPTYYNAPRVVTYRPAPWTPAWYRYCSEKYRSFDPRSGTFQPYHGPRQLCR
jgi:hypothetical protein